MKKINLDFFKQIFKPKTHFGHFFTLPYWVILVYENSNNDLNFDKLILLKIKVLNEAMGIIPYCEGFMYDEEAELNEAKIASLDDIDNKQDSGLETSDDEIDVLSYNCPFCQKLFSEKMMLSTTLKSAQRQ